MSSDRVENYMIGFYKEPLTDLFIVHGDTHMISSICHSLDGQFFPYLQHSYTLKALRYVWKLPVERFDEFLKLIRADRSYEKRLKTIQH